MKDAVLLLLCAIALAGGFELNADQRLRTCNCDPSEAEQICEANFGNENVLIAHEYCDKFYLCTNGKPVAQNCAANLLYNPFLEQCEWPDDVDCGDRPISDGTETDDVDCDDIPDDEDSVSGDNDDSDRPCNCNPGEAPSICAAEGSTGLLIAHEHCNQFYTCNEGVPVTMSCPPTLLYNPYSEKCDWPQNVECGDRVIPEPENDDTASDENESDDDTNDGTCNCNPEEAPAICAANDSEGVLVAHENCDQFYICNHGTPVADTCPNGLLFNPYTKVCDWAREVDCGDRIIPEGNGCLACNEGDDVTPPCDDTDDENDDITTLPPVGDSSDSESEDIDLLPPAGDDPGSDSLEGDVTSPPSNDLDDSGNDNNGTCNCNPEDAPALCQIYDSESVLIAHENCNQFYKCSYGIPVALSCPNNLLYNPYTEQCDWPENVDCGDRVIPNPDDVDEDSGNDGNENEGDSDDSQSDNNGGNDNSTCNCNPEEAPSICAADDSEGVLVAHENCNQFYKCSYGIPVALSCPNNLLYNPYTEQCDWPENVDCGDRVIPNPDDVDEDSGNDGNENEGDSDDSQSDNNGGNGNSTCNCNPEEAPSICTADDSEGVLVAHENCNQFYKCSYGIPVALSCPNNLLYNPYTEQCDWPENVDCGDRVIPDPEDDVTVTLPPVDEDSGNENDGDDSNSSDDDQPIGDDAGNDNDASNNSGLDEDDDGQEDTNPDESDCDNDTDDDATCNCQPDEAPSICAVNNSDGILIAHEYCNHFYKCDNGKPVPFKCSSNLLYNPYIQVCDWPSNVECGDRVIPDSEEDVNVSESEEVDDNVYENENVTCNCNPEEAPEICATSGSDGTQIAHENCNQFYQCSFGRPITITCSSSLLYNPYTQVCDWPANVECGDRVIPEPEEDTDKEDCEGDDDDNESVSFEVHDDPSQAPAICAGSGSDGVLVAHENCNQFYMCSLGSTVTLSCSGQLLFNPQINACDWPSNVDCGDRIIPGTDDCACNPRNAPKLCARSDFSGKLVAHENCNQFYMCVNGVPVARDCPANLHYNIDKEICDWPQNVNCEMRTLYSSLNKHLESRQTYRK